MVLKLIIGFGSLVEKNLIDIWSMYSCKKPDAVSSSCSFVMFVRNRTKKQYNQRESTVGI